MTATCIRVPVMRAHAESVNLQFEKPLDEVKFCKKNLLVIKLGAHMDVDLLVLIKMFGETITIKHPEPFISW